MSSAIMEVLDVAVVNVNLPHLAGRIGYNCVLTSYVATGCQL
jgi:hypothetical protein